MSHHRLAVLKIYLFEAARSRNTYLCQRLTGTVKNRIVRGSDYSPATELFSRLRKTMISKNKNSKLDLVYIDARKIGKILSIRFQAIERKRNSDVNQGL